MGVINKDGNTEGMIFCEKDKSDEAVLKEIGCFSEHKYVVKWKSGRIDRFYNYSDLKNECLMRNARVIRD